MRKCYWTKLSQIVWVIFLAHQFWAWMMAHAHLSHYVSKWKPLDFKLELAPFFYITLKNDPVWEGGEALGQYPFIVTREIRCEAATLATAYTLCPAPMVFLQFSASYFCLKAELSFKPRLENTHTIYTQELPYTSMAIFDRKHIEESVTS